MRRDARFWRNFAIVAIAHIVIAIALVGWSRGSPRLDQSTIVWMTANLSARTESASEKSAFAAPTPALKSNRQEESQPLPAPVKSEIELPVPTATPIRTPALRPSITPPPQPTPKRLATPMPKATPKKSVIAKTTPAPSPQASVQPAQEEAKNSEATKEKETGKTMPTGPGGGTNLRPSEFSWYGKMLHDRFYGEWVQPTTSVPAGAKMSALVRIRIEQDGRISKFNIVRPSGNVVLDESVAAVAKRVTQVDPLPNGFGMSFYEVTINFELNPTK
jgi:TonB family protein